MEHLTPAAIVQELDKHIIGQSDAKKAVAIALRNRYRRQMVDESLRPEITPKNILMIGPTGVGKTEIARRLAKLANAPFIKVEATKFTEVGYVGKEVDSIIRDLVDITVKNMRALASKQNMSKARVVAIERVLDILVPPIDAKDATDSTPLYETIKKMSSFAESITGKATNDLLKNTHAIKQLLTSSLNKDPSQDDVQDKKDEQDAQNNSTEDENHKRRRMTQEHFRGLLLQGKLDDKIIEIDVEPTKPRLEIITPSNLEDITSNLQDMLSGGHAGRKKRKVSVKDALEILTEEEAGKLVDEDEIKRESVKQVSQNGIVFIDEIDKVVSRGNSSNIDVSRSGVQRDLLPLVEGTMVNTRYGIVNTDHILFIASGAFHVAKPSDLLPELQGRFPVRVELQSLNIEDFERILTEPHACLITQYKALLATEESRLTFTKDGVKKIAEIAFNINKKTENIGARRLYTVMERLLEDVLFTPELYAKVKIDNKFVSKKLEAIASSEDLSRYIL